MGNFSDAVDFVINDIGLIYVADGGTNEVILLDPGNNEVKRIGGYGWGAYSFAEISDISLSGINVLITDRYNKSIKLFDKDLNFISEIKEGKYNNQDFTFNDPVAATTNLKGDVYILDRGEKRILKLNVLNSDITGFGDLGSGVFSLNAPDGFEIDRNNLIYCLDGKTMKIFDEFGTGLLLYDLDEKGYRINLSKSGVTLTKNNSILILSFEAEQMKTFRLQVPYTEDARISSTVFSNKLFILNKKEIEVYNLE